MRDLDAGFDHESRAHPAINAVALRIISDALSGVGAMKPHCVLRRSRHHEAALGGCAVASGLGKAMAKGPGVRASLPNDDPKEVATLGAFEGPHFVPSGNQRDPYGDPFTCKRCTRTGIHAAAHSFSWSSSTLGPAVNGCVKGRSNR